MDLNLLDEAEEFIDHSGISVDDFIVLDEFLEQSGLSMDDFLSHYGKKGMRWGVRRGKKITGVSRSSGALLDRNAKMRQAIKLAQSGKGYKTSTKIGKVLVGKQQQQANWKQSLKNLDAQDRRLKSGKTTVSDKLDKFGSVSLLSLAVTSQKGKTYKKRR